jgi:hypothetical protein
MFEDGGMTTPVAVRTALPSRFAAAGVVAGSAVGEAALLKKALGSRPTAPRLPVLPALESLLPQGLRRGSTVSVSGQVGVSGAVSLLLALLSAASANGAWCVLVDLPPISAEAARDLGVELSRLPLVPATGSSWVAVVGALLDAFDIVVARAPARLSDSELRKLSARSRQRGTVFMPFLTDAPRWPQADLRLVVEPGPWSGIGAGHGRLTGRQVTVTVSGRGEAIRQRSSRLWLPAPDGGVQLVEAERLAPVVELR